MTENPNTNIWTWLDSGPEIRANARLLMARPIRKSYRPQKTQGLWTHCLSTIWQPAWLQFSSSDPLRAHSCIKCSCETDSVSVWTETTTLYVSDISAGNAAFNKIIIFPPQTHRHTSHCSPTRTFRHIDKHTTSHLWHKKSSRASRNTQAASGVTQQPLLIFAKETQNLAVLFLHSLLPQLLQVRSCEEVVFLIHQLTERHHRSKVNITKLN